MAEAALETRRLAGWGRRLTSAVLVVLAAAFVFASLLRLLGIDGNRYTAAVVALTPYVTVAGVVLGVVALVLRRWWTGGVVLLLAAALVALIVPRAVADDQPAKGGRPLRILSANLYFGQADAKAVVGMVRDHDVEVLSLLELTSNAVAALDAAGLFTLLPNRVLHAMPGGAGSGLASKYPLSELSLANRSKLAQPSARVDLGDGAAVEVVAVHPVPPTSSSTDWRADLDKLPMATADLPVRLLAGDFNATLDHAALRRFLDGGYADAAARTGNGLKPTWPDGIFPPPVTIDHVLVDDRVAVNDYQVLDIPGSDHSAIFSGLIVPV
ncbi:endonuclease/exonuclease/phosphatase family protein [Amycolatopsis minnesotensis]|uniref:Endonuclease/exonuclease/phosphatase family protein n=1 Tax=Amycolatopsis minnesotensis TaxID=337894 RepID=A0ABN2Q4R7_9PSEU